MHVKVCVFIVMHIGDDPDSSVGTHRDDSRTMLRIFLSGVEVPFGFLFDSSSFCIHINRGKIN